MRVHKAVLNVAIRVAGMVQEFANVSSPGRIDDEQLILAKISANLLLFPWSD
jgi:hypothetical protein